MVDEGADKEAVRTSTGAIDFLYKKLDLIKRKSRRVISDDVQRLLV